MANPEGVPRTRPVLAEIPARMGLPPLQRVGTPLGMTATRRSALNPRLIDSPATNIPDSYLSPRMSPDEALIQQRGRRRVPIIWSPEKAFYASPHKTPTKAISAMTLRSSPRKRSLMKELSDIPVEQKQQHASPYGKRSTPVKSSPSHAKRMRFEEGSINRKNRDVPLETLLSGLSQDQLISMITGMVRGNARLEETIRNDLPVPDLAPLEEQLSYQKKNIFKSLPATRLVSKTDSPAYARAATQLAAFKKTLVEQSQTLHNAKHWDALLDYVQMAWGYVRATPVWDNHAHNAVRRHCFKILAYHATSALKHGRAGLGVDRVNRFQQKLKAMAADCEDINDCATYLAYLTERM
uniref:Putative cut8 n=1 Tax=Culex tarsalis TaxID=7177 RepID=A0A1Q3EW52_CULTA